MTGTIDTKLKNERLSHTAAITITTQRERNVLVELLHAKCAHAHSTNIMHRYKIKITRSAARTYAVAIACVEKGLVRHGRDKISRSKGDAQKMNMGDRPLTR